MSVFGPSAPWISSKVQDVLRRVLLTLIRWPYRLKFHARTTGSRRAIMENNSETAAVSPLIDPAHDRKTAKTPTAHNMPEDR